MEDADDACGLYVSVVTASAWLCDLCGEYENNAREWDRCMMCNESRGTWLCEVCAHRNPPTTHTCESCGTPNQDDPRG
jgi:predicted RNA-binding Zn-ribbon protein involved in translation (DUF1610 family)